jgi:2-polyprenyl-3-methyl-5-hydroxy-6-metoxy-1,4-benzoquinol methylase
MFRKQTLALVRCTDCSMVFASPIEEGWATGLFYDKLALPYYLSPDKLESDYADVRFARELKLFRKFCHEGTVLDVGCSTGAFLFQLGAKFGPAYDCLGMDVAGPALDYAERKGVRVLRESFLHHDFGSKRFSAITFWAILEHLALPGDFLRKAASLLTPEGFCFVLVPNFQSLAVRVTGSKYRYIFPQHINYFTTGTLKRLVTQASGLRVLYSGSTHFNPLVIWQDWRGTGEFVPDQDRAELLKRTTSYKTNPFLKPLKVVLSGMEAALGNLTLADNLILVLQNHVG